MGKTFVYNTGIPIVLEGEFHLEFGMFFDGTLYNKDNIDYENFRKDRRKSK